MGECGRDAPDRLGEQVRQWLAGYPDDQPVVIVPVFNALDDVVECLDSLLATTHATPILLIDDGSTDPWVGTTLSSLARGGGFLFLPKETHDGFVATMNAGFAWTAPRDVILVNSDVVVPAGWLERLRAAAYAHSTTATATPLTNHGTILSVPHRNTPTPHIPRGYTVDEFDRRIRTAAQRLYPRIPTAIGHCTYFRRTALTIVGGFDPIFSPGYGEEVDFSQRAVLAGMQHVVADDLFVYHKGSRSFDRDRDSIRTAQLRQLRTTHERHVATRYPWYHPWVGSVRRDRNGPLALALDTARMATLGTEILIDGTTIGAVVTGAQTAAVELVRALCATKPPDTRIALLVNDGVDERQLGSVGTLVDDLVTTTTDRQSGHAYDLIHRPIQFDSPELLQQLRQRGRRVVVTQLDFISYSNPSYFANTVDWFRHRVGTERVLASVDGVMFISNAAFGDAKRLGIDLPDDRACVTSIGVDQPPVESAMVGDAFRALRATPFIVVLGTDFRHKNRTYAVELLRVLVERNDWPGVLVFAGPKVAFGSSAREEAVQRIESPALRTRLRFFEQLTEVEKRWLLAEADLVLYPTVNEGFGLIPFEAAAAGTPTLCARFTSLGEVLGSDIQYLDMRDITVDATLVWQMLKDPACAVEQVARIRARGATYSWEQAALRTWGFYATVLGLPSRSGGERSPMIDELFERMRDATAKQQREIVKLHERYGELAAWAHDLEAEITRTESWAQTLNAVVLGQRQQTPRRLPRWLGALRRRT